MMLQNLREFRVGHDVSDGRSSHRDPDQGRQKNEDTCGEHSVELLFLFQLLLLL
eukprot:m.204289 g.204289  ORF g.204289 m.204289 type:complete len:54 (-) comp25312_c0_seq2:245-406(-)